MTQEKQTLPQIAKFEKVSFNQFRLDCHHLPIPNDVLYQRWTRIILPRRATSASAGYDFFMPFGSMTICEEPVLIPTGIRCRMAEGWCLVLLPRSSMGMKYGLRLENTAGLIDADYYGAINDGHIMVKLRAKDKCGILQGERFVQGVFLPFGVTEDDAGEGTRTGGLGSTGR